MALVETYVDSNASIITLADSTNGNRLNNDSLTAISKAINSAVMDDSIRAIIIRSNGDKFCLGMDLEFLQDTKGDTTIGAAAIGLYVDLLLKIYEAPKPIIALINGDVKAGGMGLISACDIVLASDKSTFELSEVLLGLIPANVLPFLYALRLTPQKARYLIMTAKRLNADEAKTANLVDEVYPEEKLERGVKSIMKTLFRASPNALAETKHFTQAILSKNLDESTNMAKEKLLELVGRPDVIEAVTAFNEGSVPSWFGKFKPTKPLV